MKKILFIDRDGTLIEEPPVTFQVNSLEEMVFLPGVISSLKKFTDAGYELIVITNQDALGTPANPRENYEKVNQKFLEIFRGEGVEFSEFFECIHTPEENCECRKPKTGMVDLYLLKNRELIDFENSYVIGDRKTDITFAKNIGVTGVLISPENSWNCIAHEILQKPRAATMSRKTKETEISVRIDLDGSGKYSVDTGLKFFDHMLEQIGKHGNFDLDILCKGDLEIDEHHTIEDVALTLGSVFQKALGDKRGITRYANTIEKILPMDESLATIALDISNRPECVFSGKFSREYVGDFPTEMLKHFYQSFCLTAGINMNMKLEGENTHHMVEISFKAFARALKEAVKIEGTGVVSTKGVL